MKVLSLILLVLFSSAAFGSSIYVAPVQGTNLSEQQSKTMRELVKVQVQNNTENRLVDAIDNAEFYLQTKVIKFDTYTLSMARWQGNKKISTGQWKAKDLAELEAKIAVAGAFL